jgi:threonine/homoserine/homoserine lactone efflux protein
VGIAAVGTYGFIFEGATGSMLGFAGTFLVIGLPSSFAWAGGGKLIGNLLRSPAQHRALSVTAAVLMIAAVVPALLQLG